MKAKSSSEDILNKSLDTITRLGRTSQSAFNETVTVEYIPSQEIVLQDSSTTSKYFSQESNTSDIDQSIPEENLDIESTGEFGQRVRSSSSSRPRSNESHRRFRIKQPLDASSFSEDQRKQYRKSARPYVFKKLNTSNSNLNTSSKERLPSSPMKSTESQRTLKQKETDGDRANSSSIIKDASSSTSAPIISVSLGKFSGPIVVPDFPRQKKYSYTTTPDYTDKNEVSKLTTAVTESVKSKVSEDGYLAAPPVILNPLQVGVALMNAGQDLNLVNDQITLTKLYPQDKSETPEVTKIDTQSLVQNDAPVSRNLSFDSDQVSQQEQISEVIATNSPVQSVEIQKSVEIFHTAPIQEIHYPVEFIPSAQQLPLLKQHAQEDYRKPGRSQSKDQRQSQINIYRSNEILDESINNQEHSRYEYNVNENDVIYSAGSGQVDQTVALPRPVDVKPIFGVTGQVDGAQYDQVTHSRVQGIPEAKIKLSNYELPKGPAPAVVQPSRGIESLSGLTNLENLQVTQEAPQILLTKVTSEPPTELRLLMSMSQPYSVEKNIHMPQTVDVIEKKVPYPVEKVIEKQITIPQPFPVHIPIDRVVEKQIRIPYPVHVEKVIEKKVPFAIQRFIIPLPIHFRVSQPVPIPVEKVVEKPVPVPVPVEKVVEKPVLLPRPYSIEIEKGRPYPLENSKHIKSAPIYNIQPDGNYQQSVRQNFQTPVEPIYGTDNEQSYYNSTNQFYGQGYLALNRPHARQPLIHSLPKKFASYSVQHPHSVTYSVTNGNLVAYGRTSEKDKVKDEYVGPVPRKTATTIQSKSLYSAPDVQTTLRRTRQEIGNTGNFRQSKMEYGFKPPMVPSVQYDEQTATKVE